MDRWWPIPFDPRLLVVVAYLLLWAAQLLGVGMWVMIFVLVIQRRKLPSKMVQATLVLVSAAAVFGVAEFLLCRWVGGWVGGWVAAHLCGAWQPLGSRSPPACSPAHA
jgi:hypothetical protein